MEKIRNIIDIIDPPDTIFEEIMWQKSLFDHLFLTKNKVTDEITVTEKNSQNYFIPLVPSMFNRMNIVKKMYAFHNFGPNNIKNLIEIQGKKTKQISVFTSDPDGDIVDAGIWGGTGLVALVEGDVFVGYMSDIMSIVDKKGTRLIDIGPEAQINFDTEFTNILNSDSYKSFYQELQNIKAPLLDKINDYIKNYVGSIDEIKGKFKFNLIKEFIEKLEPVLMNNKKVFTNMYFSYVEKQGTNWKEVLQEYDELVMGNFTIKKLYVIKDDYSEPMQHFIEGLPKRKFCPNIDLITKKAIKDNDCIELDFPVVYIASGISNAMRGDMKKYNIK